MVVAANGRSVSRTRCSALALLRRVGTHDTQTVLRDEPRFSSAPLRAALRPGKESSRRVGIANEVRRYAAPEIPRRAFVARPIINGCFPLLL